MKLESEARVQAAMDAHGRHNRAATKAAREAQAHTDLVRSLTAEELRAYAQHRGLKNVSSANKQAIYDLLGI